MAALTRMLGVASLSILTACGGAEDLSEPVTSETQPILGGFAFDELPGVAALYKAGHGGHQYTCTASLIGPDIAVTAAHCFLGASYTDRYFLAFGPDVRNGNAELVVGVDMVVEHPDFWYDSPTQPTEVRNDIAILYLDEPAGMPVVPVAEVFDPSDEELLLVGYGATSNSAWSGPSGVGEKRAVWVELDEVEDTSFTFEGGYKKTTCAGDSGGPALRQLDDGSYEMVGVLSVGNCYDSGRHYRVDAYADWIREAYPHYGASCPLFDDAGREGQCAGNTLLYCRGDVLDIVDCEKNEYICGPMEGDEANGCLIPEGPPGGACPHLPYCDGDVVVKCDASNEEKRIDCGASGMGCGKNIHGETRCVWKADEMPKADDEPAEAGASAEASGCSASRSGLGGSGLGGSGGALLGLALLLGAAARRKSKPSAA
ncbi:MAG: S1 family peptidase [Myxococcota bacterium]